MALASDYDETLAAGGLVTADTLDALERFRRSGRKLVLVTGRELPDLEKVFPRFDLFDSIVAENGAVLYEPASREKYVLASPPKAAFADALRARGVRPLSIGDVIVSTCHPHESVVLEVIRDLGLELQVIFNKGSVMVLPSGVNKMSGLKASLDRLGLSEHNVVGVGDAENDHAFLTYCEFSVAVANALPAVKDTANFTTRAGDGAGVVELIEMMLQDDLSSLSAALGARRSILVGLAGGQEVSMPVYGSSVLVAGPSGSGKSTLVAGLIESLVAKHYQVCLIDPEGDDEPFAGSLTVGDEKHAPSLDEILQVLKKPESQVAANLIRIPIADRPAFFGGLLARLQELRMRTGRPHWLVVDEAHQLLPPEWPPPSAGLTGEVSNVILITVHPEHLSPAALRAVDIVFAVGPSAKTVMQGFAGALASNDLSPGEALVWFRDSGQVHRVAVAPPAAERKRHKRKYAHGELGEDRSFYFRGSRGQLNLRAQNLMVFLQMAEGVDDGTWLHHLRQGDYSKWFREAIKDEELAREMAAVEEDEALDARASREKVRKAIEQRYTAPV